MKKIKQNIPNIIALIILIIVFILLVSGFSINEPQDRSMQIFPSYDWGEEDNSILAYISANTEGSNNDKQQAIIECLQYMWDYNKSAKDYMYYENLKFYKEPTQIDYKLIELVKKGQWADSI